MAERALKESIVFDNDKNAVDLGFAPRLRLKELQDHFDDVKRSGVDDLNAILPYLGESGNSL
jgi:hypothetical protein